MALKAGYVGVKRWLYEKLQATTAKNVKDIADIWDVNEIAGVHNYLNINDIKAKSGATITLGTSGFTSVVSSASWSGAEYVRPCDPGVEMVLSLDTAITSGVTYIAVQGSSDGTNYTNVKTSAVLTASGSVKLEFNTGTYTSLKVIFYTTNATVTACNVTISNILLKRAEDPSNDITPFALTNQQLTARTAMSAETLTIAENENYALSGSVHSIRRSGNICEIYSQFKCLTSDAAWTTLASAPKPYKGESIIVDIYPNGGVDTPIGAMVSGTNGDFRLSGGKANKYYNVHLMYICEDAARLSRGVSDTREASPEVIEDDPEPVTKTTRSTKKTATNKEGE